MRLRRALAVAAGLVAAVALLLALWVGAFWLGAFGSLEGPGEVATPARSARTLAARDAARARAGRAFGAPEPAKQILFGDLHVHTTYSLDAFLHSLPLMQGEGAHPPADACDFARFCAGLDFFSINDHAESLFPEHWRETVDSIRRCNAVAGDPAAPDLVAFLGWEWTQMSLSPETHFGHKNVVLRDLDDERIPARPIAARGDALDAMRARGGRVGTLLMSLRDPAHRERYYDFGALRRAIQATPLCAEGVPVRELPPDCMEAVATPRELFAKLDEWGDEAIVIPHGNAWGNNNPPNASWDNQLEPGQHDPERQALVEVYSGHGNSEQYRRWRHVERDASGAASCPEPGADFEANCWRAGEIIRARCAAAGESADECERRAVEARERYLEAGRAARFVVPGQRAADWLDAGQCRDCFQPAYDFRPGSSVQAALAASNPDAPPGARRLRFGLIASSDTHFARPATGFKELTPKGWTDAWGPKAAEARRLLEPGGDASRAESVAIDPTQVLLIPGGNVERSASFYYTGGTVAVHAWGRDRAAVWEALRRREVYGTSGPRILLWFDLLDPPGGGASLPMGSVLRTDGVPRFRVRAVGAFRQQAGCPEEARAALGPERLRSLCMNECYHPADERHAITRVEVVRIRPRASSDEALDALIEDPWQVLACPGDPVGCEVSFEDPEYPAAARDAVYYVRAIQEPTPQVNGAGLRCERDAQGRCVRVHPCRPGEEDCLASAEARAWSSPIFVDYGPPGA